MQGGGGVGTEGQVGGQGRVKDCPGGWGVLVQSLETDRTRISTPSECTHRCIREGDDHKQRAAEVDQHARGPCARGEVLLYDLRGRRHGTANRRGRPACPWSMCMVLLHDLRGRRHSTFNSSLMRAEAKGDLGE